MANRQVTKWRRLAEEQEMGLVSERARADILNQRCNDLPGKYTAAVVDRDAAEEGKRAMEAEAARLAGVLNSLTQKYEALRNFAQALNEGSLMPGCG